MKKGQPLEPMLQKINEDSKIKKDIAKILTILNKKNWYEQKNIKR